MPSVPSLSASRNQPIVAKKLNPGPILPPPGNAKVGVWNLRSNEHAESDAPEKTESLFSVGPGESVIGEDDRKKVNKKDFMPGGKYRSIVKLFLRFAGQDQNAAWAMGTGWLINNDTIVTAGHCAYDWSHDLGRLTHVKAYIGYCGKESIKDSGKYAVQFRTGKQVSVPQGWLAGGNNESRDVSFIKVDRPFAGITPIKYQSTPLTGTKEVLGVVGYPGDLMNPRSKERGAFMYEMYSATTFDISKTKTKMLQYQVDTYAGNSGSPVIRQSNMASIGVHVLGGNLNSASVISGRYGNPFDALLTAFKGKLTGFGETTVDNKPADWLSVVTVPTNESASSGEADDSNETGAGDPDEGTGDSEATVPPEEPAPESSLDEGFFNFIKTALKATGPLGMVASVGMGVVGQLLAKRKEAAFDDAYAFEGVAERALLGEAALTAVVNLGPSKCKDLGIFQRMQPTIRTLQPICRRAGPAIMPFFMEPAWRMTARPTTPPTKRNGEASVDPQLLPTPANTNTLGFGPRRPANVEAILNTLTNRLTTRDAEAFVGTEADIGEVIGKGIRIGGPILGSVVEFGLSRLAGDESSEVGVDTDPEADINNPDTSEYTYDAMTQRAIAGEAALEALLQTPVEKLQQEGIWGSIVSAVKKWGPPLIKTVGPLIVKAALGSTEAAMAYATVLQKAKTRETETEAAQGQVGEGETGNGEGDINVQDPAEIAKEGFLDELEQLQRLRNGV